MSLLLIKEFDWLDAVVISVAKVVWKCGPMAAGALCVTITSIRRMPESPAIVSDLGKVSYTIRHR